MLKTTLTLAAISLTLLLSTSVFAQNMNYLGAHTIVAGEDPFDFVSGGGGVLDSNRRCAAAFKGGQMCESIDILRSGSPPDSAALTAGILQWVKPTIVQAGLDPTIQSGVLRVFDASGQSTAHFNSGVLAGGLSCLGWSTSATNHTGLVIQGNGKFQVTSCFEKDFFAVACCGVKRGKKRNNDDD